MWFLTHFYFLQEANATRRRKCFPEFSFSSLISNHSIERLTCIVFFSYYFPILEICKYSKQFASESKYLLLVSLQVPKHFPGQPRLHSSNPNLSTLDFGEEKNSSDGSETSSEFSKMQEDLCHIAHKGKWIFFPPNVFDENVKCVFECGRSLEREL